MGHLQVLRETPDDVRRGMDVYASTLAEELASVRQHVDDELWLAVSSGGRGQAASRIRDGATRRAVAAAGSARNGRRMARLMHAVDQQRPFYERAREAFVKLMEATVPPELPLSRRQTSDKERRWWRSYANWLDEQEAVPGPYCIWVQLAMDALQIQRSEAIRVLGARWGIDCTHIVVPSWPQLSTREEHRELVVWLLTWLGAETEIATLRPAFRESDDAEPDPCDDAWRRNIDAKRNLWQTTRACMGALPLEEQRAYAHLSITGFLATRTSAKFPRIRRALWDLSQAAGDSCGVPETRKLYESLLDEIYLAVPEASVGLPAVTTAEQLRNRVAKSITDKGPPREKRIRRRHRDHSSNEYKEVPRELTVSDIEEFGLGPLAMGQNSPEEFFLLHEALPEAQEVIDHVMTVAGVTERERQVWELHERGWSHRQIGQELGITKDTSKVTKKHAQDKLDKAREAGKLDPLNHQRPSISA